MKRTLETVAIYGHVCTSYVRLDCCVRARAMWYESHAIHNALRSKLPYMVISVLRFGCCVRARASNVARITCHTNNMGFSWYIMHLLYLEGRHIEPK